MNLVYYRAGYKYQLARPYQFQAGIFGSVGGNSYIELDALGVLSIRAGYAWDGPSGPTVDTPSAMRGSLVHDALYQLIRMGILPPEARDDCDEIYRRLCVEDGMSSLRAWIHFRALRRFGGKAASPSSERKELIAP